MLQPFSLKLQWLNTRTSLKAILKVKLSSKMQSSVLIIQMASDNADALCFLQRGNRYKRFRGLTLLIITSKEMKNERLNILLCFPTFNPFDNCFYRKNLNVLIIHSSIYKMGAHPQMGWCFLLFYNRTISQGIIQTKVK